MVSAVAGNETQNFREISIQTDLKYKFKSV